MSATARALPYAHARVQAHLGRLPAARDWREWYGVRTLPRLLDLLRSHPFAAWLERLDDRTDPRDLERQCADAFRREVVAVAHWHPEPLAATLHWMHWLPAMATTASGDAEQEALPAVLAPVFGSAEATPRERWQAWRTAWSLPDLPRPLDELLARVFAEGLGSDPRRPRELEAVARGVRLLYRRHATGSLAAVAYLALAGLELARLRALLVDRLLFAEAG